MAYGKGSKAKSANKNGGSKGGSKKRKWSKKNYSNPSTTINKIPLIMPDKFLTKLKYTEAIDTDGAYTNLQWQFHGNSLYDPDAETGGQQPPGFDNFMAFYSKYRVTGCKIRIMTVPTSGSATPAQVALYPGLSDTYAGSIAAAMAQPYSKSGLTVGYGSPPLVIENYMSTKRIFGQKDISDSDYAGTSSANPTKSWYWHLCLESFSGNITAQQTVVELTYYCQFSERIALANS